MKTLTSSRTTGFLLILLAPANLATVALSNDQPCDASQIPFVEYQTAAGSRSKCGGFPPYLAVSPTKRYLVETGTETASALTLSANITPSTPDFSGKLAACGGTATLATSFSWDMSGGNSNASVSFQIIAGSTIVTNYSLAFSGGSASASVFFPLAGGQYPFIQVSAHSPSGGSSIDFHPTQTLGTVISTYTIQTNSSGCQGPSTTGAFVTMGYNGSVWTTDSTTSRHITNSPSYTPAQDSYALTGEYSTAQLESLARSDIESVTPTAFAARGPAAYVTAKHSLTSDELSIYVRKMRARMTFASVPGRLYRVSWIEASIRDNSTVASYQRRHTEVYGTDGAQSTTVVSDWIAPPTFNGEISIVNPMAMEVQRCVHCQAGSGTLDADGVDFSVNLGSGGFDRPMGDLSLQQRSPVNLGDPGLLAFIGDTNYVEVIKPGGTAIQQVRSPQMLANIVVTSNSPGSIPLAYRIDCYTPSNVGAKGANGLYQPLNSPFASWAISNQDANPTNCANLQILETRGSKTYTNSYAYTNTGSVAIWSLSTGNGLGAKSSRDNFELASTGLGQIFESVNPAGAPVKHQKSFQVTPLASSLEIFKTSETNGARTIQYSYDQYGRLASAVYSDGKWVSYVYDGLGRVSGIQTPFMNYAPNSGAMRMTSFEYGTNYTVNSGDNGQDLFIPRWIINYISPAAGYPEAASSAWTILGNGWRKDIVPVTPNTPWNDANNQVTTTTCYTNGAFKDRLLSIDYPDSTREVYFYQSNATNKTITILKGEADPANSTNVVSGSRSIEVVGVFGETLATTNYYFSPSAGAVLTGSEVYEYLDDMGKSYRCHYLNGTTRLVQYSCCGLEHIEEPDGTSQWFYNDDLKRKIAVQSLPSNIIITNQLDALGRVVSTTQVSSNGTSLFLYGASYDPTGRISSETNALYGVTSYAYGANAQGQYQVTITNPDQGTRIETYASDGSLNTVSGTAAFPMTFETQMPAGSGLPSFVTTKIGANGATSEWRRDDINFYGSVHATYFPYPGSGLDVSRLYTYNVSKNQLIRSGDEDSVDTLFAYDALGQLDTTALDRDGNSSFTYAGPDRISKVITDANTNSSGVMVVRKRTYGWEEGSSSSNLFSTTEVSIDGLQSWETIYANGLALITTNQTAYYTNGLIVTTTTSPDNSQYVVTNRYGRRISETAYDGGSPRQKIGQVIYGYDQFGRRNTVTDDRNGTTTYYFNNVGQISGTQSPAVNGVSLTTSNYFDNMGRVWKTTLADGTSVTNEFYPTGLLKKTSGSRTYPVQYNYDTQGRVTNMITWNVAGPETNTWLYNANRGWLEKRIYPDGTGPSYLYTGAGRLATRTWVRKSGSTPISATYTYNNGGELNRINFSDASLGFFTYFNRLGQLTNVVDYYTDSGTTKRVFDRLANLLSETYTGGSLNGLIVSNQYDGFLRRTNLAVFNGSTNLYRIQYTYDAASRLQTVAQSPTLNFQPISANYRYVSSSPLVESIAFTNNGVARLTLNETYDNLDRLKSISALNPQLSFIDSFKYGYNPASQRTAATNEANAYWVYQYDKLGQVKSARRYWPDGTAVAGQQYDYTYDDIGNVVTTATGGDPSGQNQRTATWSANSLNQYTSRIVPGYIENFGTAHSNATITVNPDLNIGAGPQSVYRRGEFFRKELAVDNNSAALWQGVTNIGVLNNGTNADIVTTNLGFAFVPATPEIFLYDPDGNLINDGRFSYTWDGENHLTTMTSLANAPADSRRRLTVEYDWQGRRIRLGVSVWTNNNWLVTTSNKFCYDGWNLVAELNATNNALIRSYAWGLDLSGSMQGAGGVGGLLWVNDSSTLNSQPSTHLVTYDGNGNVSSLINASDGSQSGKYEYGPFGDLIQASGLMARANPIRYSSKYQENVTGLLYYGQRYYSPGLQRFLNRDPIGERGGLNVYGFVNNNPINAVDPFGLDSTLGSLFLGNVSRNGLNDASRYANRLGQMGVNAITSLSQAAIKQPIDFAQTQYRMVTDPVGLAQDELDKLDRMYQGIASASGYLGKLSTDDCEQERVLNRLKDYLSTPEAYADMAFSIDSILAGGLLAPEAGVAELEVAAARAEAAATRLEGAVARTELQGEFGFANNDLSGRLSSWGAAKSAEQLEFGFVNDLSPRTTVLGALEDTAKFKGRPGFNVLDIPDNVYKTMSPAEFDRLNAEWLNAALRRGDSIWAVTDPAAHAQFLERIRPGLSTRSRYLNLELPMLEEFGATVPMQPSYPPVVPFVIKR